MRYQHWDVLLFPDTSRIPIQEFDTKCNIIHDQNSLVSSNWAPPDDPFVDKFESLSKTPILTSFVPSLTSGSAFRISIHSWGRPQASSILRSRKTQGQSVAFQAFVHIDGVLQCSLQIDENTVWPAVITSSDLPTSHIGSTKLKWPQFHPEILQQAHWDASEQYGRIRLTIAEGIMRKSSSSHEQSPGFHRVRDVITFAFQHAPQNILEYSAIAWPNQKMFERAQTIPRRSSLGGKRMIATGSQQAHAHSPQASMNIGVSASNQGLPNYRQFYNRSAGQSGPPPTFSRYPTVVPTNAFVSGEDPFMGPTSSSAARWRSQIRSSDVSMSDDPPQKLEHSRTETEMSGVDWPRRDFQKHIDEAAIDEIIQALSPSKKDQLLNALSPGTRSGSGGPQPPTNTPLTAESSNAPTPEAGINTRSSESPAERSISLPKDEADLPVNPSRPRARSHIGDSALTVLEQGMVRRSLRNRPSATTRNVPVHADPLRDRSSSRSSKRKRSMSPISKPKPVQKVITKSSPLSKGLEEKENASVVDDDDSIEAGVAIES